MNPARRNHYRKMLEELHERVGGEVNYVVESIHEEMKIKEDLSSAPVHLADVAEDAVDADVKVLQTERGILDEIQAALARIDEGTYGRCTDCGTAISEQRLSAIPYTAFCVKCARTMNKQG
jgi:RNA polymerase-binding protein DksA